ncbi:MAG: hypothetical protein IKQ80_01660, partial [Clostridia bacterium]|nr:hypothetical protein [Clostridia bacterium]
APAPETPVRGASLHLESPKHGGVSDPRSAALIRMFNLSSAIEEQAKISTDHLTDNAVLWYNRDMKSKRLYQTS